MANEVRIKAVLYTLGSSFLWGSSFAAVKVGLRHLDPLWFALWRTLGAGVLLGLLTLNSGLLDHLRNRKVWLLAVLNACAFSLQNIGMLQTTASKAAFYVNLGFVGVALLSWLVLHERFGPKKIVSIALGVAGVTGLATQYHLEALRGGTLLGDFLVVSSGLLWACYFVITKLLLQQPSVRIVPLTSVVLTLTGLFLLPVSTLFGDPGLGNLGISLPVLLYTAIFCSAIPLLLWTHGLRQLTPTASAVILLAEPVIGALLGFGLLGERFSDLETLGALLILAAIALYSHAEMNPDDR